MSATVLQPAALACFLSALLLGLRRAESSGVDPRPVGDRSVREFALSESLAARAARRYDRTPAGVRLASRLWSAQIAFSPSAWRAAQLLVAIPLGTMIVAIGAPPAIGVCAAMSIVRGGGSLLLQVRRHRARDALDAAAPLVARALAIELSTWGSGAQAIVRAADRCRTSSSRSASVAARVLESAAARVALGGEAGDALQRAVQGASRSRTATSAAVVSDIFALHLHDAAATAAALERLAGALDENRAVRREARATVGDVRMSAIAVPAIAAATGVVLLSSDPPALAAALSVPLLPVLGIAVVVVAAAVVGVRRLVAL